MEPRERSDVASIAALGMIGATFVVLAAYVAGREVVDDAAISLAYAKHLVRGDGLVLSPGANAVEGYSNFLWVLILAPFTARGVDAILAAKALGITLSLAALLLLAHVPGLVERRRIRPLDLLAPALTGLALPFALWSASGLENGLEAFLLVLAVALSLREIDERATVPASSLAFLALALTRPEGVVFWSVALAHRALLVLLGRRRLRRDVEWMAAFIVPFALYHTWHYLYFGEFVPNTYFAKAGGRSPTHLLGYLTHPGDPGLRYVRMFLSDYWLLPPVPFVQSLIKGSQGLALGGLLILVLLVGLCLTTRRVLSHYALPLAMLLAGFGAIVIDGGDWMPHYRLVGPLLPLLYLCVQESVRSISSGSRNVPSSSRAHTLRIGAASAIAATLLGTAALTALANMAAVRERPFGADYSAVNGTGMRLQELERCLMLTKPSVLTPDIGAIAYNTDFLVIDLAGLGDAYIARHPEGPDLADYVFRKRRPDVIWIHQPWLRGLDQDPRLWGDYAPVLIEEDPAGNLFEGAFVRRDLLPSRFAVSGSAIWPCARS